ncbi:PAS domain S-box-containing protein [Saccharicrinis carchari]|uniref:histidine kinase n=1 Tax=Saccharicrinis carchari TaxID=1168039 RepID=A0A521DPL0_SACCC|nr:PAS domain S-box protein [Saccharicrinis carchari]SMO72860.1 PAS domain S-box-containing protein [Saccharicrinis carchari]
METQTTGGSESSKKPLPREPAIDDFSIEDIPHQIWYLTSPRKYGAANKAHADFLGYEVSTVYNADLYDLLPQNEADAYYQSNHKVFESKKTSRTYGWFTSKNSERRYLSITKAPKLNSKGHVAYVVCTAIDITAQKQIEESLLNTEQKYRIIVDNTNDIIVVLDSKGMLKFVNDRQQKMLGYNNDEILGTSFTQFVPSRLLPIMLEKLQTVLKTACIQKFESKLRHRDGREIDVEIVGKAVSFQGESTIYCTIRNISERIHAQKQIQYQLELRKTIMELASTFINIPLNKTTWAINYSLKKLAIFVGADRSYIFDYNHKKQIAINTGEYCKNNIKPLIKQSQAVPFSHFPDWVEKHSKGEDVEILNVSDYPIERTRKMLLKHEVKNVLSSPLMHGDHCTGFIGFDFVKQHHAFTDDEKQMIKIYAQMLVNVQIRSKAEENNAKLLMAIEQNPTSIIITNIEGVIQYANPYASVSTGYTKEELIGKKCNLFKSGFHNNHFYKIFWDTILSGKTWVGEFLNKKKNGDLIWEKTITSPIINPKGNITNFVSVKLDITERKKMIGELELAKEKAEESDRLKSAFLANMSHEIRNPLNGIIGFSTFLAEDSSATPDEIKRYANIISNSGNHLLSIINDIIYIAKFDSGYIKPTLEPTNVKELLHELIEIYKEQISEKKRPITILLEVPNEPLCLITDPTRLRQILENLLSNALKFTSEGSITLGCSVSDDYLHFFVRDTGIGIEKDKQGNIFDRFIQASSNTEKIYGGTGLGLSITKACVEMLGGQIWLHSEINKGSTFYFTINYTPCDC